MLINMLHSLPGSCFDSNAHITRNHRFLDSTSPLFSRLVETASRSNPSPENIPPYEQCDSSSNSNAPSTSSKIAQRLSNLSSIRRPDAMTSNDGHPGSYMHFHYAHSSPIDQMSGYSLLGLLQAKLCIEYSTRHR